MKRNTKILLIGGIAIAITGIGAYFLLRKPKSDDDILRLIDNQNSSTSNANTSTSSSTNTSTTQRTFPPTPFQNNNEGNHFRNWVNNVYPNIAREIDLDRNVSFSNGFNNSYIRRAWSLLCFQYVSTQFEPTDVNWNRYRLACENTR